MTSRTLGAALAAVLVAAAAAPLALAQGPLQQKVHYTINVSHELRMGDYLLPPGRYELYQANVTDLNLFALYQDKMMHSPLALIRTTRIAARDGDAPAGEAAIRLSIDEQGGGATPMLRGWTVPGEDGWEIIGVDGKDRKLARVK